MKAITLTKDKTLDSLTDNDFTCLKNLLEESWIILSPQEQKIKERIEEIGTPLKEWDINIYRGVLTGYNEAFIIDGKTKDELIAKDPKSAEIIKPILRGRDIKRYKAEFADLWLINTHNGYKKNSPLSEGCPEEIRDGVFIPPIDINNYPAIKEHLDQYWDKLKKRQDKGITPYNLRNCAYLEEFEKEKIVWKALSLTPDFAYTNTDIYNNDKANILTLKDNATFSIKYLLSYFNSKLFLWQFSKIGINMGRGFEFKIQYMNNISIPKIPAEEQKPFETLVDYILFLKNSPLIEGWTAKQDGVNSPLSEGCRTKFDGVFYKKYKQLPYNPKLKEKAKELRKAGNLSEVIFWNKVKNKQFLGLDFHRQKIIGNYIVDFYCPALDLVIEIDGESHDFKGEYDEKREEYLKSLGLNVIHFNDKDIKKNIDSVIESLQLYCEQLGTPRPSGTPLQEGRTPRQTSSATPLQEGNGEMSFYFEQIIDGMVYELYFEKEIQQAGCEIIKHLGNLPEITEDMSDSEKREITNKMFVTLYDKNHPVRKNLKAIEEKVEEVKIIKESLEK